jgi:hypothetical protein
MGDALDGVILVFLKDVGRLPTPYELREGLEFSLGAALYKGKERTDGDKN